MSPGGPFESGSRYNSYGAFLRRRFGRRVHKVSVDAGFTCPNRDGTVGVGGCTFCDNSAFIPRSADRCLSLARQIEQGKKSIRERYRAESFIVYFQPFSNTHAPLQDLIPLYEEALAQPDIVGISLGTRADCIDEAKIAWLEAAARRIFVTVEYGLESVYDRTLARINRGHDFSCFIDAVELARNRGIFIGAHLILGFPWETREQILDMARVVSGLDIDFLKLHQLHVVRDTAMGREYLERPFRLLALVEYVALVIDFIERLSPKICLERLSGTAPEDQLLAPRWVEGKDRVRGIIEEEMESRQAHQGRLFRETGDGRLLGPPRSGICRVSSLRSPT